MVVLGLTSCFPFLGKGQQMERKGASIQPDFDEIELMVLAVYVQKQKSVHNK